SGPTRVRSRCTAHDYKQSQAAHYHPKPYASWGTDPHGRKTGIGSPGNWRTYVRPRAKKSIRILMGKHLLRVGNRSGSSNRWQYARNRHVAGRRRAAVLRIVG